MSDLDALLAGIVADPANAVRWLVMADWLEDHGFPERAELVRVHRELLRTCTDPDAHPDRPQLHARMMDLMRAGVQPCLPQKTLTLPGGVELRMSFIPPGSFLMGSPILEAYQSDEHLHLVTLTKGFWMGQTQVTQRQWRSTMRRAPSEFKGDDLPVESVSWKEAVAFCTDLQERYQVSARLPTEAEWEYGCRSGTSTPYFWGDELDGTQANCEGRRDLHGQPATGVSLRRTMPVGSYAAITPHPWSLVDCVGNVREWCKDKFGPYPTTPATDPKGPTRDLVLDRIIRGGGWRDMPRWCRSAFRGKASSDTQDEDIGFRLAADGNAFD